MAFLGTLFIYTVIEENLPMAILWLSIILQVKPHWAFALGVPLLLGRFRFFFKLLGFSFVAFLLIVSLVILIMGPTYGLQQYIEYIDFLIKLNRIFPWRTQNDGFIGYNNSIKQIVVYILGIAPWSFLIATLVKIILLAPLAWIALHYLRCPSREPGYKIPEEALDLAFVLYTGTFIWLDMVWELSLGVPLFIYLLGTLAQPLARALASVTFLPYALLDPWRTFSLGFNAFGWDVVAPGLYLLIDPSIYIPLIMISILVFYTLLICRLREKPGFQFDSAGPDIQTSEA